MPDINADCNDACIASLLDSGHFKLLVIVNNTVFLSNQACTSVVFNTDKMNMTRR